MVLLIFLFHQFVFHHLNCYFLSIDFCSCYFQTHKHNCGDLSVKNQQNVWTASTKVSIKTPHF